MRKGITHTLRALDLNSLGWAMCFIFLGAFFSAQAQSPTQLFEVANSSYKNKNYDSPVINITWKNELPDERERRLAADSTEDGKAD